MEIKRLEQQRNDELRIIGYYEKRIRELDKQEQRCQYPSEELEKLYVEDERLLQEVMKHLEVLDKMNEQLM